jgi:AcrR family transcriptional regulator
METLKKEKTVDRRIQKTRKLLIDALLALTIEKGYDKVTIQDIIDKANVGRSTFYAHFESKDQLLTGNDNFQDLLSRSVQANSRGEINFLPIYEHVAENHRLARVFLGKQGSNIVTSHFHNIFHHLIKAYYKDRVNREKLDKKLFGLIVESASSAMCSLLFNWATNDMPFAPGEMAGHSHDIVKAIFRKYL